MSDHADPQGPSSSNPMDGRAKILMVNLENLLNHVYADIDVPREKVRRLVIECEALAEDRELWDKARQNPEEFLEAIHALAKKIYATLDLKRLREEGLVKAVKL